MMPNIPSTILKSKAKSQKAYDIGSLSSQERNTTPHQLILDSLHQYLYIFLQSQQELVIFVGLPSIFNQ